MIVWLLRKIKHRIPALLVLIGCQMGTALLGVAFALGTRGVIDSAIAGNREEFIQACLLQGGIILGILVCLTISRHLRDRLTADLDRDWKKELLHGLLQGEYEQVSAFHTGELLNRMNNDVRIINDGLIKSIPNMVSMVTRLVSALGVLIVLEPWFTVVVAAAGILVVLVTGYMRKKLKGLHKQVSSAEGKVSGFIQETLEKLLMVQAMDVAEEVERRADVLLDQRYDVQRKRKNVSLFANTGISVMSYAAGFAALVWCAFGLLEGRITFGSLTAVTQLVGQLQGPFVNLSGAIPQYTAMSAAAERLMELDAICGENTASPKCDGNELYEKMTELRGENLCFSYDRDVIFDGASFTLPKDSFAVITGPSGIGKSTLLKLMLGIFSLHKGKLYAMGKDDTQVNLDASTRSLFAYVPQGNLLFSGTLRENLLLTKPDASEADICQAIFVSAMDEYVSQLPDGLETLIGENGAGLSEGQAQRLAIGRAVLSGAPILLLDEITSSLDSGTEQLVLSRIRALPGRTCIAVTHRPAAVELADWNLSVENGKLTAVKIER